MITENLLISAFEKLEKFWLIKITYLHKFANIFGGF